MFFSGGFFMIENVIGKALVEDSKKSCFIFCGEQLLLTDKMEIPTKHDDFVRDCIVNQELKVIYEESACVIAELDKKTLLPASLQLKGLKEVYLLLPTETTALVGKARQLLGWKKSHQFCGECGAQTYTAMNEYRCVCNNEICNREFYPRISPVVIIAVERNDEILLARSPHFPENIYSALAGFVEPGESVEECAHREVFEETGIKICNLRYFKSQSWPFPNELILGFQADYESGKIICDPNEIEDAAFFHIDKLPETFPGSVTVSKWLLDDFCKRHGRK